MVLCFYRVSVVFCLFGTAGTNCTLSRAFELLLIVGMVKKEEDSAASGQGWRFINWQLNPHINLFHGESSQFQRSVFMDILLKKLGKNAEIRVASVPRMTECGLSPWLGCVPGQVLISSVSYQILFFLSYFLFC